MASLKPTLDKRRSYKDGKYPLVIRLTHHSSSTYIKTAIRLREVEWDSQKLRITRQHPNYSNISLTLKDQLIELEKKLLETTSEEEALSLPELKEALLNQNMKGKTAFYSFAVKEILLLKKQERFGNAQSYETAVNRLVKFAGKHIQLGQINYTLLSNFDAHLVKEGLRRNSVAVYMREIRALMNKAIHKGILKREKYPFNSYKIKSQKTANRSIDKDDLRRLMNYPLSEGSEVWHSRNIFLLIFNLIGISFIDLVLLQIGRAHV